MNCNATEAETIEHASLYALGALNQNEARAFEEHLKIGCEACESELQPFRSVVSLLGSAATEVEPPAGAREKLMTLLAETATKSASTLDVNSFLTLRANEGEWCEASAGILVKRLFLDKKSGAVTSLFKFAPGVRVPRHHHSGVEQCLVLEGDFQVNNEKFGPGDFSCAMPGSVHESIYSEGGALVLIVAHEAYQMS